MAITIDQFLRDLTERELLSTEEAQTVRRQLSANVPEPALKADAAPSRGLSDLLVLCDCLVEEKLSDEEHQLIFNAHRLRDDSEVTIHLLMPRARNARPHLNGSSGAASESSPRPRGITDVARHGEMVFVCCETLEAETFEQVVRQNGALPLELATETLLQTARTLHRLSLQGFSLPEVSADVLLLDEDGEVHVAGQLPAEPLRFGVSSKEDSPSRRLCESLGRLYGFLFSGRDVHSNGPAGFAEGLFAGHENARLADSARKVHARLMGHDLYRGWDELIRDLERLLSEQEAIMPAIAAEAPPRTEPISMKASAATPGGAGRWVMIGLALLASAALVFVLYSLQS